MKKAIALLLTTAFVMVCSACVPEDVQTISGTRGTSSQAVANAGTDLVADSRPVAVVVDNFLMARPVSGLAHADIVFETEVWEGITRFIAVYNDYKTMPVVGPVRELYNPLLQFVLPAQPLVVSDGVSKPSAEIIEQYEYSPYIFDTHYGQTVLWLNERRVENLSEEYCRYTDGNNLASAVQAYGTASRATFAQPLFIFGETVPDGASADLTTASTIYVPFSEAYQSSFTYDDTSGRYLMSQSNKDGDFEASKDEAAAEQLAFDNVVVLFASMKTGEPARNDLQQDSLRIQFDQGGEGYYFHDGVVEPLTWAKNDAMDSFHLYHQSGRDELTLDQGATYVAVMNGQREVDFSFRTIETGA